jgi:hypothetical protein
VGEKLLKLSNDQRIAWEAVRRSLHHYIDGDRGLVLLRLTQRYKALGPYDRPDLVGNLLREEGHYAAALGAYRDWLAMAEQRAAQAPKSSEMQRNVAVAHDNISDLVRTTGNATEALAHQRAAAAIRQRLAETAPERDDDR